MLIKNGEYNSLWRLVGELKSKESKTIPLPVRPRGSLDYSTPATEAPQETPPTNIIKDITPVQNHSPETKSPVVDIQNSLEGDQQDNLSMMTIEDHQKRHRFASSLYEAQQNYRELRRLLKKINGPLSKEQQTQN